LLDISASDSGWVPLGVGDSLGSPSGFEAAHAAHFMTAILDGAAEAKLGRVHLLDFSSCKELEYRDLGQELIARAMDRMKVLGMGRLGFQFFAQLQNVVIDRPCTRIVLVSPHLIE
jgi:hypothetical protein